MVHPQTLAERLSHERRGAILTTLSTTPGYRANERLLHDVVADAGLPCTRDQVRTEMSWLGAQGYITVDELVGGILVGEITQAGMDVAANRTRAPGVAPVGVR